MGAVTLAIVAGLRQVFLRLGRLALFVAIAAPTTWYLLAASSPRAPSNSKGLYGNSIDVHGMSGPASWYLSAGSPEAREARGLSGDSVYVASINASTGAYSSAIDAHGMSGESTQRSGNTLVILASRLAIGIVFILVCALLRRMFSRTGPVWGLSSRQTHTPLLPTTVGSVAQSVGGLPTFGSRCASFFSILRATDVAMILCFGVWYYGNYEHNITNKLALRASGGAEGFPLIIATCQLGVGVVYATFLWIAPDSRKKPTITVQDWVAVLPLSFFTACAHAASVFALSAGALSFSQIVKSCEPAFAALVGVCLYKSNVSRARWLCLIPIIGGVALSAMVELDFAWGALLAGTTANIAAAVRSNENKRLMATDGIKDRLGSVGNQYAITTINAFLMLLPLALLREGSKLPQFIEMMKSDKEMFWNVLLSGWWFYIYNEVATIVISKTGAVTQSIANTAKRAVVIILGAIVMGESLGTVKLIGCSIAIGGVFLYSQIDDLMKRRTQRTSIVGLAMSDNSARNSAMADTMVFTTPQKIRTQRSPLDSVTPEKITSQPSPLDSVSTATSRSSSREGDGVQPASLRDRLQSSSTSASSSSPPWRPVDTSNLPVPPESPTAGASGGA